MTTDTSPLLSGGHRIDAPYRVVGTVSLLRPATFHYMSQYPGADVHTLCQEQTVPLLTNGYYAKADFDGMVTARGYYGGGLNGPGRHHWRPYAYDVDALMGRFADYHGQKIVDRVQEAWGDLYRIDLD